MYKVQQKFFLIFLILLVIFKEDYLLLNEEMEKERCKIIIKNLGIGSQLQMQWYVEDLIIGSW